MTNQTDAAGAARAHLVRSFVGNVSRAAAFSVALSLTLSSTALAATTFNPATLPTATVGTPYSTTISATTDGGEPQYWWGVDGNSLPSGLTQATSTTGITISGTPTSAPGSYPFTTTFNIGTTVGPATGSKDYTLTVAAPASTSTTATLNIITTVVGGDPSLFTVFVTGAGVSPSSFVPTNATTTVTVTAGQPYAVTVPTQAYSVTPTPDCASTLAGGDTVTCHLTLTQIPAPQIGQGPINLITNAQLETAAGEDATRPYQWFKGIADANNATTYEYPATNTPDSEISSGKAARITLTGTPAIDAKWYFAPVAVLPGKSYAFSDSYIATVATSYIPVFCTDAFLNECTYGTPVSVEASAANTWKQGSATTTIPTTFAPSGKQYTYMTVFHTIDAAGSLTVDNFSLSIVPAPSPFPFGFVSLTFDDGYASHFTSAFQILSSAGIKGTFYVVTHLIDALSIFNQNLEANTNGAPTGWDHAGSVAATYTYATTSPHSSSHAAQVTATSTNSNAGWYFKPVTVLADSVYSFSGWYRSTGNSELVAQITLADGTQVNAEFLGDAHGSTSLGTSIGLTKTNDQWTQKQAYFYVPANARTVTVINRLTDSGSLTVDDYLLGAVGYISKDQLTTMAQNGQEIGNHTETHPDLTTLTPENAAKEIGGASSDLIDGGFSGITSLAYPYGANNQAVQDAAQASGLVSGRTVAPGWNGLNAPHYGLLSQSVNADTTLEQVESWVATAKADKTWLILTFHDINADLTNNPYGATPTTLTNIVTYLKGSAGLPIKTVAEGMVFMNASTPIVCGPGTHLVGSSCVADTATTTPDTIAPVITLTGDAQINLTLGSVYTEQGATATDNVDATTTVTIGGATVNTAIAGTYQVTYDAVDTSGNHATQVVRTVTISAPTTTTPPRSSSGGHSSGGGGGGKVLGASTTGSSYVFVRNLTRGMSGQDVTELQKILISAGHLVLAAPSGYFGDMTFAAVKKYQAAHGIQQVGNVGPLTRTSLNAGTNQTGAASAYMAAIAALQKQIAALQALLAAQRH